MSGIEAAGLVLGALPLLISAIEKYNEGLDPIKAFYSWEKELPKYIHKLRLQHVHYEQNLRLLLTPITTEAELVEMMNNPIEGWRNEIMAEKLRSRLDEAYAAYQSTIADIEKVITKIASKLDLERATTIKRSDLEAMLVANPLQTDQKFHFRRRVRFSVSKKRIKSLLEELDESNRQLERFTDKSDKIDSYRRACKPSFAQRVQRIQAYAKSLHGGLVQSWSCSCRASHGANLQLEQRIDLDQRRRNSGALVDNQFSVSFWSSCAPWTWQNAKIEVWEQESSLADIPELPSNTPKSPLSKRVTRGVSFDTPPPPPVSLSRASTLVASGTLPVLEDVEDMCDIIKKFYSPECLGFSLDVGGNLRGTFPVADARQASDAVPHELVSLDMLLEPPGTKPNSQLTKKERYILAVTIASSALQLYGTPWIEDYWSKKDILFRRLTSSSKPVDIDQAFVRHRTDHSHAKCAKQGSSPKNTVLLALALTLLELYFGQSHETVQLASLQPHASGQSVSSPWILLALTSEWVNREEENLSFAFSSAVKSCLQFFHDPTNNLVEASFLQQAIESILLPLQDELSQFLGKAPT